MSNINRALAPPRAQPYKAGMSTHKPLRLPESMTRIDIGPYMRGLREHFGLSQQDVSERLHIRHRYINAIENNAFDQMPGQAYAKGYVHTYAEFLGLDADQVVEISFGPEPVREQQRHFVPEPMKRGSASLPGKWRGVAVAVVVMALGVLMLVQLTARSDSASGTDMVAEVPEEMLAEMRRLLMPTAANYHCLQAETPLGCLLETADWRRMKTLLASQTFYFVDVRYAGPMPVRKAPPIAEPAQEQAPKAPVSEPASAAKKPASKQKPPQPASAQKKPASNPAARGRVPDAKPEGTRSAAAPSATEPAAKAKVE
jgi:hypothetical protein